MSDRLGVLVADDEALARRRLRRFLGRLPGVDILAEASTGSEALEHIEALSPDLVFLDIRMPGVTGTEVARRVRDDTRVVFVTAYSEHAAYAFEVDAVDYLVKPIEFERVEEAVERVRQRRSAPRPPATESRYAQRIFVSQMGSIVPVPTRAVVRLEASGDYVIVHTAETRHYVHATLASLVARLDPDVFLGVHRSHVVNLGHVRRFVRRDASRMAALMSDGSTVDVSRRRAKEIRALAE